MEVVADLSTDSFISALQQFIANNNGTNFIGTNSRLKEVFNTTQHNIKVTNFLQPDIECQNS